MPSLSGAARRIGVWIVVFICSMVSLAIWESVSVSPVNVGTEIYADEVSKSSGGVSRYAVTGRSDFALIAFPVSLRERRDYKACLPVISSTGPVKLVIDFSGFGYDSPTQERQFDLGGQKGRAEYCFTFNSEQPPHKVALRVMLNRPEGGANTSVAFEMPSLFDVALPELRWALMVLMCVCIAAMVVEFSWWTMRTGFRSDGLSAVAQVLRARSLMLMCTAVICSGVVAAFWIAFGTMTPWVFADEYSYSWLTKHAGDLDAASRVGLVSTIAHSFLFFALYGVVSDQYTDLYIVAKAINLLLWFGAAGMAYVSACRFIERTQAILFASVVLVSPWVIYTRVFMPEVMYVFGFWCSVAVFAWFWRAGSLRGELLLGMCLGALTLVKSHATFLVPGFALGCLVGQLLGTGPKLARVWRAIAAALLVAAGWYLSKTLFSTLSGPTSVTGGLVGGYGGELSRVLALLGDLHNSFKYLFDIFLRHIGVVAVGGGIAIALVGRVAIESIGDGFSLKESHTEGHRRRATLGVVAMGVLVTLLIITTVFTAAVAGGGAHESIERMHTRYYGFAIPLVLLVAMIICNEPEGRVVGRRSYTAVVGVVLLSAFGGLGIIKDALHANDAPDALVFAVAGGGVAIVALWIAALWASRLNGRNLAVLIALWGAGVGVSNIAIYAYRYVDISSVAQPGELAGRAAKFYLPGRDVDEGAIYARSESIDLYRFAFRLNGLSPIRVSPACSEIPLDDIMSTYPWVITFGYAGGCFPDHASTDLGGDVWLYRFTRGETREADIERPAKSADHVDSKWVYGVDREIRIVQAHERESWGTWLTEESYVEFSTPVSGRAEIEFVVHGFGENVGRDITVTLGGAVQFVKLAAEPGRYHLIFDPVNDGRRLLFEGLRSQSPRELGVGDDNRALAMGLSSMTVTVLRK